MEGHIVSVCLNILVFVGLFLLAAGILSGLILMGIAFYRVWVHPDDYVHSLEKNASKYGYNRVFGKGYYRKWTQRVLVSFTFASSMILVSLLLWMIISMLSS